MPYKLNPIPYEQWEKTPHQDLRPGDCWVEPLAALDASGLSRLSEVFKQTGRQYTISIMIPGRAVWEPDLEPGWFLSDIQSAEPTHWAIRDLKTLSAHPSIHHEGVFHGWLKDGVISDDLDGRQYTEFGKLVRSGGAHG